MCLIAHLRLLFPKRPKEGDSDDLVNRIYSQQNLIERDSCPRLARFAGFARFVPINLAWRAWQAWRKQKLDL